MEGPDLLHSRGDQCDSWPLDGLTDRFVELLGLPDGDHEVQEIADVLRGALDLALETDQVELLRDCLFFAHQRLAARGLTTGDHLWLTHELELAAASLLSAAQLDRLHSLLALPASDGPATEPVADSILDRASATYLHHLLQGDRAGALALTRRCVSDGVDMFDILVEVLEPAQREVGRLWALGKISIAQEHFCTAVTQFVMTDLYPAFFSGAESSRRLVAVNARGSAHHVGLRMVTDVLECRDWSTTYVIEDVADEALPQLVVEERADLVLISASMAGHVGQVKRMIRALRDDPRTQAVHVVVGGRPFSVDPALVQVVGADGSALDARSAVAVCDSLVGLP